MSHSHIPSTELRRLEQRQLGMLVDGDKDYEGETESTDFGELVRPRGGGGGGGEGLHLNPLLLLSLSLSLSLLALLALFPLPLLYVSIYSLVHSISIAVGLLRPTAVLHPGKLSSRARARSRNHQHCQCTMQSMMALTSTMFSLPRFVLLALCSLIYILHSYSSLILFTRTLLSLSLSLSLEHC